MHCIEVRELKDAKDNKCVVHHPVWDLIEPDHFVFLHVVENYYDSIEDQVEAVMPEQKVACNKSN
jgi:hypothetical protein